MSDQPTPPAGSGSGGPEKEKSKRNSRSPVPKALTNAISDASETAGTAKKEAYAAALAKVGIDATFVAALEAGVARANKSVSDAIGAHSDKSTTTDVEEKAKRTLEALGLRHHQAEVVHPDHPALRGMLHQVRHLVEVTVDGTAVTKSPGATPRGGKKR